MSPSFLSPLFLLGLPLAALPVIIHLLTRRVRKPYPVSSLRFIRMAAVRRVRRHKLREFLVLALRCLMLAILALLFSRPVLTFSPLAAGETSSLTVLLMDVSYSMRYWDSGKSRLERAKDAARTALAHLRPQDQTALISCDERAAILIKNPTTDLHLIREELAKLEPSYRATSLKEGLKIALEIFSRETIKDKRLLILSDFQESGWKNTEMFSAQLKGIKILGLDLSSPQDSNRAILRADWPSASAGGATSVEAVLQSYGPQAPGQVQLTLQEGAEKLSQGMVQISRDQETPFRLATRILTPRLVVGTLSLEPDALSEDDVRYLSCEVRPRPRVLLVDGDPKTAPVASETYYLRYALEPGGETAPQQVKSLTFREFETEGIASADILILANPPEITEKAQRLIYAHIRKGGDVIFFLGDKTRPALLQERLSEIFPAEILEKVDGPSALIPSATNHPALSGILDEISSVRVHTRFKLKKKLNTSAILSFEDGAPAILEREFPGTAWGSASLVAFSADRDWTNFPAKPSYLPFLHQWIQSLTRGDSRKVISAEVGEKVGRSAAWTRRGLRVKTQPEDFWEIPGIYRTDSGDVATVNLNAASGESLLKPISEAKLRKIFSQSLFLRIPVRADFEKRLMQALHGQEVSAHLTAMLLCFLLAEGFLANRLKRS